MSETASRSDDGGRPLVLFDFDGTLMRGDCVARLLRGMIDEQPWRRALALAGLPLLGLFASWRTAWIAVSWFSWVATVGREPALLGARREAFIAGCVERRDRLLLVPVIERLRAHVDAGDRVVIVTGAEHAFARALWRAVGGHEVELVGSRTRRRFGGEVAALHCFGRRKLVALAAQGIHPPFAAMYSDSAHDLPLLASAARPVLVSDDRRLVMRLRRRLPRLEVLAPA